MYNLNPKELKILKSLKTPKKIQDYINKLEINFDYHKETCMSPRKVMQTGKCHCIEGAILAALALRINRYKPLIIHLAASRKDFDHVIAVFQKNGKWGAISKTNHGVLRYREPIYYNLRELVMSYFHEYFNNKTRTKTLRSFSAPLDLSIFDKRNWATDEKSLWYIDRYLNKIKHYQILTKEQITDLRKADKIEVQLGKITEFKSNYQKKRKT